MEGRVREIKRSKVERENKRQKEREMERDKEWKGE